MEPVLSTKILSGLAFAQIEAHNTSTRFGNWKEDGHRSLSDAIALIHRDAAQALEISTVGNGPSEKLKDFSRLEEKLADIIIRALDLSGGLNLCVAAAVIAKMNYNEEKSKLVKADY